MARTRLTNDIPFATRAPGQYFYRPAGIPLPVGSRRFFATIPRPNTLGSDAPWPDLGENGKSSIIQVDNGKSQITVGGLDTELVRAYFFLSLDAGLTWESIGHVATLGGNYFTPRGDLSLESTYTGRLPDPTNPNRRIQGVLQINGASVPTALIIDVDDQAIGFQSSPPLHRSIAVEGTASGNAGSASSVSSSGNLVVTGSNRVALLAGYNADSTPASYTSLTFNGVTATNITDDAYRTYYRLAMSKILDASFPATGTITYTVANTEFAIFVGGVTLSGVDQTTPNDTPPALVGGTTTAAITVTAGDTGDVRIAFCGQEGGSGGAAGTGENDVFHEEATIGGYREGLSCISKTDGGSDAMNISWASNNPHDNGIRGFNVNIASAGGRTTKNTRAWNLGSGIGMGWRM